MRVQDLIEKIPSDTFDRVKQANKRYNQIIREAIRSETRLKLKPNGSTRVTSVPVQVDEVGYPEEIGHRKISDRNKLAAILSLKYASLVKLLHSSNDIRNFLNPHKANKLQDFSKYVLESLPDVGRSLDSIFKTYKIAGQLLRESLEFNLVEDILSINKDILGAYFFDYSDQRSFDHSRVASLYPASGKIKLYWGIIGLFANALGLETEDVTAVVISHELAHAYTHLGFDIDQNRWDSGLFFDSDHDLKESLAQYYTQRVMESLQDKIPGGLNAFKALLVKQPESYKRHTEWIKHSTPESVRNVLILLRSKNTPVKFEAFDDELKKITKAYKRNSMR